MEEEKNIKQSPLYVVCFIFAALEVLGIFALLIFVTSQGYDKNIIVILLLLLLALYLYYLNALWKPRQGGVKFFLLIRTLGLITSLIYFFAEGFEPWPTSIATLLIQTLLIRAYYKLLLDMPFEY